MMVVFDVEKNYKDGTIYCLRCGRKLVGKKSREIGFGPKCFELWLAEQEAQQQHLFNGGDTDDSGKL